MRVVIQSQREKRFKTKGHEMKDTVTKNQATKIILDDVIKNNPPASAEDALTKIRALKEFTRRTGFRTTRSVNDILESLNATMLSEVCAALNADASRTT